MTIKEIREKIEKVIDPSRGKSLKELKAIKHIGINEEKNSVVLIVELGKLKGPHEEQVKRELAKIIKIDLEFNGIKIQFEENKTISSISNKNTEIILISSAKGGTGKSSVCLNLAYALTRQNKKVAIIDNDIYCASISKMMGIKNTTVNVDAMNKILPYTKDGIEIISTDFFSDEENPLMWRGSMLASMTNNFLFQVSWSKDLDYILIDCPNGTGDILLDLGQFLPTASVLLVSEDDMLSAANVLKAARAHELMKQVLIGIVINKYKGNTYAENYLSDKLAIETLAKIPYTELKANNYLFEEDTKAYEEFNDLATLIITR